MMIKYFFIIAVTGRSSMSGLEPFPVIEDGNFHIPDGGISKQYKHARRVTQLLVGMYGEYS